MLGSWSVPAPGRCRTLALGAEWPSASCRLLRCSFLRHRRVVCSVVASRSLLVSFRTRRCCCLVGFSLLLKLCPTQSRRGVFFAPLTLLVVVLCLLLRSRTFDAFYQEMEQLKASVRSKSDIDCLRKTLRQNYDRFISEGAGRVR